MTSATVPGRTGMAERVLTPEGVLLCVDTAGDPADPAVLLIAGATASLDAWPDALCERLAAQGRFVVRYDHRDTGRSVASPAGSPAYTMGDLSADPLRVLDGLGLRRAHLVGMSMGGGIAQALAARHADRVATVTLLATSPIGARRDGPPLPPPEPRLAAVLADPPPEPDWQDPDAVVDHLVDAQRPYAGTLGFDEVAARALARRVVGRTRDLRASLTNHWVAITAPDDGSGDRDGERDRDRRPGVAVPALVLHGTRDPLFPFEHGLALAAGLPGAVLVPLPGMGHEMPPPALWDVVVPAVTAHTARRAPHP